MIVHPDLKEQNRLKRYNLGCGSETMLRLLKELYFTAFTIFFRLGVSGTPNYNAAKGVGGVAYVEALILLTIKVWFEMLSGRPLPRLPKWAFFVAFFALCLINHYALVIRRHGVIFEQEFANFEKPRKILLVTSCLSLIALAVALFLYPPFFIGASSANSFSPHPLLPRSDLPRSMLATKSGRKLA